MNLHVNTASELSEEDWYKFVKCEIIRKPNISSHELFTWKRRTTARCYPAEISSNIWDDLFE